MNDIADINRSIVSESQDGTTDPTKASECTDQIEIELEPPKTKT